MIPSLCKLIILRMKPSSSATRPCRRSLNLLSFQDRLSQSWWERLPEEFLPRKHKTSTDIDSNWPQLLFEIRNSCSRSVWSIQTQCREEETDFSHSGDRLPSWCSESSSQSRRWFGILRRREWHKPECVFCRWQSEFCCRIDLPLTTYIQDWTGKQIQFNISCNMYK